MKRIAMAQYVRWRYPDPEGIEDYYSGTPEEKQRRSKREMTRLEKQAYNQLLDSVYNNKTRKNFSIQLSTKEKLALICATDLYTKDLYKLKLLRKQVKNGNKRKGHREIGSPIHYRVERYSIPVPKPRLEDIRRIRRQALEYLANPHIRDYRL
jgi:hypothetical protein